jgi:2-dehydropantoate 2-reductase
VVVLMQNGLGYEDEVARIVPGCEVLAGLCFLCSNKVGPGHIRHVDYGSVRLAKYAADGAPAGVSDAMRAVAADLSGAGIRADTCDDLLLARWQKLVWNVPMSGLSVVLDTDTRSLMLDPHTRALAEAIMRDVVTGAQACGRLVRDDFVQKMIDMTQAMVPYQASMKVDYDQGKPMEVEAIYGNPARAAKAAGGAMPLVEMLYQELKFLDGRKSRSATLAQRDRDSGILHLRTRGGPGGETPRIP